MVRVEIWQDVLQNTASIVLLILLQLSFSRVLQTRINVSLALVSLPIIGITNYFWYDLYLIIPIIITLIYFIQLKNRWIFLMDSLVSFILILLSGLLIIEIIIKFKQITFETKISDINFIIYDTLLCITGQYIVVVTLMTLIRKMSSHLFDTVSPNINRSFKYIATILSLYILSYAFIANSATILKVQSKLIVPLLILFTIVLLIFTISSIFLFKSLKVKYNANQQRQNNRKILGYMKALEKSSVQSEKIFNRFLLQFFTDTETLLAEDITTKIKKLQHDIKQSQKQFNWLNILSKVTNFELKGLLFGKFLEMTNFDINFKLIIQDPNSFISGTYDMSQLSLLSEILDDAIEESQFVFNAEIQIHLDTTNIVKVICILPEINETEIQTNSILLKKTRSILSKLKEKNIQIQIQYGRIYYELNTSAAK